MPISIAKVLVDSSNLWPAVNQCQTEWNKSNDRKFVTEKPEVSIDDRRLTNRCERKMMNEKDNRRLVLRLTGTTRSNEWIRTRQNAIEIACDADVNYGNVRDISSTIYPSTAHDDGDAVACNNLQLDRPKKMQFGRCYQSSEVSCVDLVRRNRAREKLLNNTANEEHKEDTSISSMNGNCTDKKSTAESADFFLFRFDLFAIGRFRSHQHIHRHRRTPSPSLTSRPIKATEQLPIA